VHKPEREREKNTRANTRENAHNKEGGRYGRVQENTQGKRDKLTNFVESPSAMRSFKREEKFLNVRNVVKTETL